MSAYQEASHLKEMLKSIVNEMIENHPLVKSAIKAQKAVVWELPNTAKKTVKIKFLPDIFNDGMAPLEFPYNSQIESYLLQAIPKQTTISVWFNQSVNNGIVMQDGPWSQGADDELLMPKVAIQTDEPISSLTTGFYSISGSYEKAIAVGNSGDRLIIFWDYNANALKFTVTNNGEVQVDGATIKDSRPVN